MAGGVAYFRWEAEEDICSAGSNPSAYNVYFLTALAGIGAMFRIVLLVYLQPPVGPGWLWAILLIVVVSLLQLAVVDVYLLPELQKWWQHIETNGTTFDSDLDALTDDLVEAGDLLNTSRI